MKNACSRPNCRAIPTIRKRFAIVSCLLFGSRSDGCGSSEILRRFVKKRRPVSQQRYDREQSQTNKDRPEDPEPDRLMSFINRPVRPLTPWLISQLHPVFSPKPGFVWGDLPTS